MTGLKTAKFYPDKLLRVQYYDEKTGKRFSFLTNNFVVPPLTIAELYVYYWDRKGTEQRRPQCYFKGKITEREKTML